MGLAKVGDKVVITRTYAEYEEVYVGEVGTVTVVHEFGGNGDDVYELSLEGGGIKEFYEDEVELYAPAEERNSEDMSLVDAVSTAVEQIKNGEYTVTTVTLADGVEHPSHYTQGRFETIEMIAEVTQGYNDGFTAHCAGTALKYLSRAPYKHESPVECLKKARQYLDFAIEHEEKKRQ